MSAGRYVDTRRIWLAVALVGVVLSVAQGARAGDVTSASPPSADRGRDALTLHSYIGALWDESAYARAGSLWEEPAPDPVREPEAYASAFERRYGLHPAPYPNDGLPMGLRRSPRSDGRPGLAIDCMLCHGGSIGGTSYVGLGNSQLDLKGLFEDLARADGQPLPPSFFTLNTARGTNNAGMLTVVLLSGRNAADLSPRRFPILTGAWLPELDTPAWWILGPKRTKMYDGRTDARAARSNMQFLLGDSAMTLERLQQLEPTFRDIDAYLKSLAPPRYPFPIDARRAEAGRVVFEANCARCHGTYGPDPSYPNKVIPIDVVGTDPARLRGLSGPFLAHYNTTWLGSDYPVVDPPVGYQAPPLLGLWATAPYLHNGSVPTLAHLLRSSDRPARYRRPPSTGLEHYDPERVGWRFEPVAAAAADLTELPPREPRWIVDTARFGLGRQGHTFGDALSDPDRQALIEYLKTL